MSDELQRVRSLFEELEGAAPKPPIEVLRARFACLMQPDERSWFAHAWAVLENQFPRRPQLALADTGDVLPESTAFREVPVLLEAETIWIGLTRAPEVNPRGTLDLFVMIQPQVLKCDHGYELWAITADGPLGNPVTVMTDREVRASFPLPEKLRLAVDPRAPATWPFRLVLRPARASR
jgi:hypothetical protein